jgi:hypothetical protein
MLDTQGYKHTLIIYNIECLSTASMISRTRLHVTLYVHFLSSQVYQLSQKHPYRRPRDEILYLFCPSTARYSYPYSYGYLHHVTVITENKVTTKQSRDTTASVGNAAPALATPLALSKPSFKNLPL